MSKMASFRLIALALSMLMIIGTAKGRWLDLETYSTSMIPYGVHNISNANPPNLELRISNSSIPYGEKRCKSLFGFLPCANTLPESVLLMFLYGYLMMSGDEWSRKGSEALFMWIGADKKVGSSVFQVLVALPKIIVFVVPGILSSASDAQNQVVFGVNLYAGSTVITLTLVWGITIICSNYKRSSPDSSNKGLSLICNSSFWTDTSVKIDEKTGIIAVIMLLSLIPFAYAGLVTFVNTRAMTLSALIVSGVSLLLYFGFQIWHPWIGARSLAYLKQENLRACFLYNVMRLAGADLHDEQGKINVTCIQKLFDNINGDKDGISHDQFKTWVEKEFVLENDNISEEYAKAEILVRFDKNKDGKISWEEFEQECTKWIAEGKNEASSSGIASKSLWNQVRQTEIKRQRSKLSIIEKFMPGILKQVREKHEIMKDGEPNREMIEGLLSQYDKDNDGVLHRDELKQFINTLRLGILVDHDRVLDELIKDFDGDKSQSVDKEEFVDGFIKWIQKAINHDQNIKDPAEAIAKFHKDSWGDIYTHMKCEKPKASILYLIIGVAVMITITSAFITSVKQFSKAAHISFLFTSFVLAPIALKAKMAIKALRKPHDRTNASLTFSEIYDELVMSNLLGLFSLLATLYIEGLSWTYSAEVFTIMIPCSIVGTFALIKRDNYPVWASIPAILLYPVSVCIYCLLAHARTMSK